MKKTGILLLLSICLRVSTWGADPPRLIISILVDQFRYDYLERYHDQFAGKGFRLLTDDGTFMTFARYNYCPTVTGPGHASYLSGTTPKYHGIIGNEWLDKKTGRMVNCVSDPGVIAVGTTNASRGRYSPKNFIGANFADQMRLHYHSKVIGISFKDRAAILPAGKKPAGAYWFDTESGNFITSTYYMAELPDWVKRFNARKVPASYMGAKWTRLLEPRFYPEQDRAPGEANLSGEKSPTFDHTIAFSKNGGYGNIMPSPYGNQLLVEFAKAALDGEKLGQSGEPDLFCVSFSSIDTVGHKFGPYSQEVHDMTLRLDRQLAELFRYVDKKVGLRNCWIVLTADHGVAPTPEYARQQGLDGGRFNDREFLSGVNKLLVDQFGSGKYFRTSSLTYGELYLDHSTLKRNNVTAETVLRIVREEAMKTGLIFACYTRDELIEGDAPGYIGGLVMKGYNAERGGDMVFVTKPFVIPGGGNTGTTHGTPYSYDTHIPVLFYGSPFKRGRHPDEFYITDIVPTLSAALGMDEPPACIGKPCLDILRD
jgi:predicted AlkP superfamily pyrophosphatase or phosphodiesterase